MATITTRAAKGSALTFTEVDNNFTNLNADGISNSSSIATLQNDKFDKAGGTITGATTVNATFTLGGKSVTSTENNSQSGTAVSLTVPGAEIVRLTNAALVSVAGILAGSSGQKVVLVNRTNTTVEVENESSSAVASSQIFTGTGGSLLLQSNASISLVYDATTNRWNIVGGSGAGTGSGLINYIENPDASIGTTGYTTYDDGAAAPVDGSGGSPKAGLFVRSTTSPLRGSGDFNIVKTGATSYQGNDNADLAKVLTVTFDYEIVSGTYADGDFTVYLIQDPTGTPVVIQPAGYKILSATAGTKMKQIATFQTDSSVKNYRLCFHCATTSALDYTLALDSISVGPQVVQYGAPVTDWQAYTPTTQGFGTISNVDVYWRRVGSDIQIRGSFTTGTVTAAGARINFPTGLTSTTDTTQDTVIGTYGRGGTTSSHGGFILKQNGQQYVGFGPADTFGSTSNAALSTQLATAVVGSTEKLSFEFFCPILGWSSTVQMSNDTDTRVVAARASGDPASAASGNPIIFPTTAFDTHGAYSSSTGRYTVSVPGFYRISGAIVPGTGGAVGLFAYVNAVSVTRAGNTDANTAGVFTALVQVNAGDLIDIRPNATLDAGSGSVINFERLSGPSAIAASETVAMRYTNTAGTALTTSTTPANIPFATKTYDTHGIFSGTIATIPVSGKWRISSNLITQAVTLATTNEFAINIFKNGSVIAKSFQLGNGGAGNAQNAQIHSTIDCIAGDTLEIRSRISAAASLSTTANENWICIERVGN
jgi:hypothetical protein